MLTDSTVQQVLRLIALDAERPWASIHAEPLARVPFRLDSPQGLLTPPSEFQELKREMDDLGFSSSREDRIGLSLGGFFEIVLSVGAGVGVIYAINEGIKATSELPESLRRLRAKLFPRLPLLQLGPALQLEPVHRWLDAKHGPGQWRYDPEKVETRTIAEVTVFRLHEEATDTHYFLVVAGDDVVHIPLPPPQTPDSPA